MSDFKRGISDVGFVKALNLLQEGSGNYWSWLLADPDIFVAIRDNYINAYFLGNNICKLEYRKRTKSVVGKTHYKYIDPDMTTSTAYVNLFTGSQNHYNLTIDDLKRKSRTHSSIEKDGVHRVCKKEDDVLDVEIEFTRSNKTAIKGRTGKFDRLDYLKLEEMGGKPMLVFYEAKDITNSELRARVGDPPVVEQMRGYTDTLKARAKQIVESYNLVCKNIVGIDRDFGIHGIRRNGILLGKAQGNLDVANIDFKPRLIIFGYDKNKESSSWKDHYKKLENELKERLIMDRN